jgi:hypothetical protein
MIGTVEIVLTKRYGAPRVVPSPPFTEYRWNNGNNVNESVLYKSLTWDKDLSKRWGALESIYGDSLGGFLVGVPSSLKLAMMRGPEIFGLYSIDQLQARPEIRRAKTLDPAICFFMDAANVWFYGSKGKQLFVFDSETDELDSLGPFANGLDQLLAEWEQGVSGPVWKAMTVVDVEGAHEATNLDTLETCLWKRQGGECNSFWLSQGPETYPRLSLLVTGKLATLHYLPEQDDAGYASVGRMEALEPGKTITFAMSNNRADDVIILNDAVLPFSLALEAAKQFFLSQNLPRAVEWRRLSSDNTD